VTLNNHRISKRISKPPRINVLVLLSGFCESKSNEGWANGKQRCCTSMKLKEALYMKGCMLCCHILFSVAKCRQYVFTVDTYCWCQLGGSYFYLKRRDPSNQHRRDYTMESECICYSYKRRIYLQCLIMALIFRRPIYIYIYIYIYI
jgi:hypothetical protein